MELFKEKVAGNAVNLSNFKVALFKNLSYTHKIK
jgi:hypothetical protein